VPVPVPVPIPVVTQTSDTAAGPSGGNPVGSDQHKAAPKAKARKKKSHKKQASAPPTSRSTSVTSSSSSESDDSASSSTTGSSSSSSSGSRGKRRRRKRAKQQKYEDFMRYYLKATRAKRARKDAKQRAKKSKASVRSEPTAAASAAAASQLRHGTEPETVSGSDDPSAKIYADREARKKSLAEESYDVNRNRRAARYTTRNIYGDISVVPDVGTFRNPGDSRYRNCKETASLTHGCNTSCTFLYKNMQCVTCKNPHSLLGKGVRPVFVLADQSFPPSIPVTNGRCIAIMRVEDSSLSELAETFCTRLRTDWLPPGTAVFIGAVGQLARVGISEYTLELARAIERIKRSLPAGAVVSHAPLLLLNGSVDPACIRSAHDLLAWLNSLAEDGDQTITTTTLRACASLLCTAGSEVAQPHYIYRAVLPTTLESSTVRGIWTSDPHTELPAATRPLSVMEEADILTSFAVEVNSMYNAGLATNIEVIREVEEKEPDKDSTSYVFVGNHHAKHLYDSAREIGLTATHIGLPDLDRTSIGDCAKILRTLVGNLERDGSEYMLVYSIFDHQAYRDRDGRMAWRGAGGITHLRGNVVLATDSQLADATTAVAPLLSAGGLAAKAVLTPVPQYINNPCCGAGDHCTNVERPQYQGTLMAGLPRVGRILKEKIGEAGIRRYRVINITPVVLGVPAEVAIQQPTVLSVGAYHAVVNAIMAEKEAILAKRKAEPRNNTRETRPRMEEEGQLDWDWATQSYRARHGSGLRGGRRE